MRRALLATLVSPIPVLLIAGVGVLWNPMQPGAAPRALLAAYLLSLCGAACFALPFHLLAKRFGWHAAWQYAVAGGLVGCIVVLAVPVVVGRPELWQFPRMLFSPIVILAMLVAVTFWSLAGRQNAV